MQAGGVCSFVLIRRNRSWWENRNSAVEAAFRADRYLALGATAAEDFAFSFCNAS